MFISDGANQSTGYAFNGIWHWQTPTSLLTAGATSVQVVFDGSGSSTESYTAPITVAKQ